MNPQSPAPEADALSIRPQGHTEQAVSLKSVFISLLLAQVRRYFVSRTMVGQTIVLSDLQTCKDYAVIMKSAPNVNEEEIKIDMVIS